MWTKSDGCAERDAYLASAFHLERASGAPPLPELALEVRKLHDSDVLDTIHVGTAPVVTFGRHSESSVQLLHQSISRHHAAIVRDAHRGMLLVDLGSSEGTTLNGEPCPAKEGLQIARGDVICFAGSTRAYTVVIDGPDRLQILKARYAELEAELRLLEGEVSEESRTLPSDRPANEHPDARRIYVANLSFKAEPADVAVFFEEATGVRVVNVNLPRNQDGELTGYGFVELDSSRGIKYALARDGDFFHGPQHHRQDGGKEGRPKGWQGLQWSCWARN